MPNICTIITKETHANQICFEVLALKEKRKIILAGVVIGVIAAALVWFGNPKNMGFCIACFIRDTAGAVGMHQAAVVQYIRPEIIGLVLGALIVSAVKKEFLPRGRQEGGYQQMERSQRMMVPVFPAMPSLAFSSRVISA